MTPEEVAGQALALLTQRPKIHNQKVWFRYLSLPDDDGPGRLTSPDDITLENEDRILMCSAGAVCLAAGYTLIAVQGGLAMDSDGNPKEIPDVARDLLGLDQEAGEILFAEIDPAAALAHLRRIARRRVMSQDHQGLRDQVMQFAIDNPELHDQGVWFRNKTVSGEWLITLPPWQPDMTYGPEVRMCVAAMACHLSGYTLVEDLYRGPTATRDGDARPIQDVAQEVLGLDETEAWLLFASEQSVLGFLGSLSS